MDKKEILKNINLKIHKHDLVLITDLVEVENHFIGYYLWTASSERGAADR